MEVLQEMNLSYEVVEGTNDPRMMRKLSYRAFVIKSADKVILVNDEEGNATFIVFNVKGELDELKRIFSSTKEDLKSEPNVETIIYTGEPDSWKDKIREVLTQLEPDNEENIRTQGENTNKKIKPKGFWLSASLEELKAEIRKRGLDPANLPLSMREGNSGLIRGLTQRFGGLSKARIELGGKSIKKPDGYWQNISLEELKKEIQSRGLDPENLPPQRELSEKNSDLARGLFVRFGSINKARRELGGDVLIRNMGYWQNASVEEIKKELERLGFDPKNLPPWQVLSENHSGLTAGLAKRFGSFSNARAQLGGDILYKNIGYWQNISIEDLKAEIRRRGLDPGNLPPQSKLVKENSDLVSGISQRFGNLSKARKELGGYLFRVPNGYWQSSPIHEIIAEIKRRGLDPGNLPGMQELKKEHGDLVAGLVRRFGGIPKATEVFKKEIIEEK
jgi:hypothetical protein